jgi:hypothetical protein
LNSDNHRLPKMPTHTKALRINTAKDAELRKENSEMLTMSRQNQNHSKKVGRHNRLREHIETCRDQRSPSPYPRRACAVF